MLAVIKKDGSHALYLEPRDAEKLLVRAQAIINNFKAPAAVVVAPTPEPAPQPKPVVVETKPQRDPTTWTTAFFQMT